jgi:hypothetical protein
MGDPNSFRAANERIADKARTLGVREEIPFICECSELNCFRTVRWSLADYDDARTKPAGAVIIPGHPSPRPEVDAAA